MNRQRTGLEQLLNDVMEQLMNHQEALADVEGALAERDERIAKLEREQGEKAEG